MKGPRGRDHAERVVVTGMGALTPLGHGVEPLWAGLTKGESGIGPMTRADATDFPCKIAGEVRGFDAAEHLGRRAARRMARFSQLAVVAAGQALLDAGLRSEDADGGVAWRGEGAAARVGVLLGNGNGGFPEIEAAVGVLRERGGMRLDPHFMPMELPNMAACQVSLHYDIEGYNSTVITACAAATQAIGDAAEVIRRGAADVMITGGTEAGITRLGLAGFSVMRSLSTSFNDAPGRASRPFDARRDGFVPAEGAAILVLERLDHALARRGRIYAELVGYASSSDAHHVVAPDPEGRGAARAMQWALEDAGVAVDEVDYINAHGTSTPLNDAAETVAIKRVFGRRAYEVPISSTKSMVGHALGASGAIEAVACVRTITDGVIHPTVNYEVPDPVCDLDYVPNEGRSTPVEVVLSNSFGFGGQNACLVFRRWSP